MKLTRDQILRYSRHLILPEVGVEGQEKLLSSRVLLVGAGGLGSPLGLYLAAAGVGKIGIVDFDTVDVTNLQRQVAHTVEEVGKPKVESAARRMRSINPDVQVAPLQMKLTSENIMGVLRDYDLVVDGTDNFPTRYLVNDACVMARKPNIYGSIYRFEGQVTVFAPGGPCYRCLYPEPPPPGMVPSCAEGGVLGVLPGVVGCLQANEALKVLLGKGEPLVGRLLLFEALSMHMTEVKVRRDPHCPVCGDHPTITKLIDYEEFCGITPPSPQAGQWDLAPRDLEKALQAPSKPVLVDVREPQEHAICHLPNSRLIPLASLVTHVHELDTADDIVVYCHYGQRSQQAVRALRTLGFQKARNLRGGIDAWSREVDPTIPRY
ncbi:MAG: molybdopterin-synthase adenylyltransferase MoeB [Euryarchaeota archaeon]|nr:molybdopterin-synthase adenylyltransferase MoeB [Euryarchaeota archaeon]